MSRFFFGDHGFGYLTSATLGLGVVVSWAALAVCGFALGIPWRRGRAPEAAPASPSFRYRASVLALLGSAATLAFPSLREISGGLLRPDWQERWYSQWSATPAARAAASWARATVGGETWPASPVGRALSAVAALWALAAVVALARALATQGKLAGVCRRALEAPPFVHARAAAVARRLAMPLPALRVSEEIDVPFATGVLAPRIVLPRRDLADLSTEQLDFVLHHEMVHIERGDLRVAALVAAARVIFTGHPARRGFLSEIAWAREASVDARVAADSPLQYAAFLVTLAGRAFSQSQMKGTVPMADSNLSRRVALLLSSGPAAPTRRQRRALALLGAAGAAFAACLWLAPTSWASASVDAPEQPLEHDTGCRH